MTHTWLTLCFSQAAHCCRADKVHLSIIVHNYHWEGMTWPILQNQMLSIKKVSILSEEALLIIVGAWTPTVTFHHSWGLSQSFRSALRPALFAASLHIHKGGQGLSIREYFRRKTTDVTVLESTSQHHHPVWEKHSFQIPLDSPSLKATTIINLHLRHSKRHRCV